VETARSAIRLGLALVLAAAAFDLPSLYVPGVALTLLWAGSLVWVRLVAQGARIERERGPATVVEGEPYPLRIRVRRGRLPPRGELFDPLLEDPVPVRASIRADRQLNLTLRFPRRGRRQLKPAILTIRDPLGLHRRELQSGNVGEVLVLPRTEPVVASADGGGGKGGLPEELGGGDGASTLDPRPIDVEVDGLRPYREGSPASRIHWPAVARTGDLHERRLVAGAESSPLVVLDAGRPDDQESLDRAVRAAASLCLHLARGRGGCTLLLPGETRAIQIDPQLRAWPDAHVRLALVEDRDGAPAIARVRRAQSVFWVTARTGGRPASGARALAARMAYLVTPAPVRGLRSRFTVAGCHGQILASPRRRGLTRARTAA
jgi:uncharacterized protein (DUF58 family)